MHNAHLPFTWIECTRLAPSAKYINVLSVRNRSKIATSDFHPGQHFYFTGAQIVSGNLCAVGFRIVYSSRNNLDFIFDWSPFSNSYCFPIHPERMLYFRAEQIQRSCAAAVWQSLWSGLACDHIFRFWEPDSRHYLVLCIVKKRTM